MRNKIYYPKAHITEKLFTEGKEWMSTSGQEYVGYYHRYIDGLVMTEAVYNPLKSIQLIPYVNQTINSSNAEYNKLITKKTYKSPTYSIYVPVLKDYNNGFFKRHFIVPRNSKTYTDIIEINNSQYSDWLTKRINSDYYNAIQINWKLTGPLTDTYNDKRYLVSYGVTDSNKRSIELANIQMPGISDYITNYIEFTIYSPYVSEEIKKLFGA